MEEQAPIEEKMRYRDLVLQVKRFVKFAPRGTEKAILVQEAEKFSQRLDAFMEAFDRGEILRLKRELKEICDNASEKN